jgi:hypothetical protein
MYTNIAPAPNTVTATALAPVAVGSLGAYRTYAYDRAVVPAVLAYSFFGALAGI